MRTGVCARVRVTLDIPVSSHWGDNVQASQIRKQATEEAIGLLRQGVAINGFATHGSSRIPVEVVGTPNVTAIIIDLDAKTDGQ